MTTRSNLSISAVAVIAFVSASPAFCDAAPSTSVKSEYLMTLYAPLDAPQAIDATLYVYNVPTGGWVDGPKIKGKIIPPSGDWLRILPSGASRLDVRLTVQTDDAQLIYVTYNGIAQCGKEASAKYFKGEVMKADDCYFHTAPTFQTKSEKYAWLNGVQAVGNVVAFKSGEAPFVKYDLFVLR